MNTSDSNEENRVDKPRTAVEAKRISVLRTGIVGPGYDKKPLSPEDDESAGFDPYDTASLYVK